MPEEFFLLTEEDFRARIRVIGVGGAGGNAVNHMISNRVDSVDFIAANTDIQALDLSRAPEKIQIGKRLTQGLGAGGNPELGREAAQESLEQIRQALAGSHLVFITAGLGGGTGTGAAPVIARLCREMGILTVGVVTKPFRFEGRKRTLVAQTGHQALLEEADAVITVPNDRLRGLALPDTPLMEMFARADEVLLHSVKGIADLIMNPGYVNLDFADLRAVLKNGGVSLMGIGMAIGENRAMEAVERALYHPLLEDISIAGARAVLLNIMCGPSLTMDEMVTVSERVYEEAGEDAEIIWGATNNQEADDEIRVTLIATGMGDSSTRKAGSFTGTEKPGAGQRSRPARSDLPRGIVRDLTPEEMGEYLDADTPAFLKRGSSFPGGMPERKRRSRKAGTERRFEDHNLEIPNFMKDDASSPKRSKAGKRRARDTARNLIKPKSSQGESIPSLPDNDLDIPTFMRKRPQDSKAQSHPSSKETSLQAGVPGKRADRVHFSVTAPASVSPGNNFLVDVWAHFGDQLGEILERARRASPGEELMMRTKGPVLVHSETLLRVNLWIEDCVIEEEEETIYWEREIGCASFAAAFSPQVKRGAKRGTVTIFANGLRLTQAPFTILVGLASGDLKCSELPFQSHRKAFASYASEDRDAVLARIQGIQKALPEMEVFLDVVSLRSGQDWERRLWEEIPRNDVFYLFWSRPAKASPWVEKEWRCALEKRGLDFIDPVPLESPEIAPPPPELASRHFNDWTLAFRRNSPK